MFWKALLFTGGALGIGSIAVHYRGKAKIGDTVMFYYRPQVLGGMSTGTQAIELTGRVVSKYSPVYGPLYNIQLFSTPKNLGPEVDAMLRGLPSTIEGVKDKDITKNLGHLATVTP